jgi:hypothetical protein
MKVASCAELVQAVTNIIILESPYVFLSTVRTTGTHTSVDTNRCLGDHFLESLQANCLPDASADIPHCGLARCEPEVRVVWRGRVLEERHSLMQHGSFLGMIVWIGVNACQEFRYRRLLG